MNSVSLKNCSGQKRESVCFNFPKPGLQLPERLDAWSRFPRLVKTKMKIEDSQKLNPTASPAMRLLSNRPFLWVMTLLTTAIFFFVDLFTPLGVVDWVWYVVPLMFSLCFGGTRMPYLMAVALSALSFSGWYFSPLGIDPFLSFETRTVGACVLFLMAVVFSERNRVEQERKQHLRDLAGKNRLLENINKITANAISTLELEPLLNTLLNRLVEVMSADTAVLFLNESGHLIARASLGTDPSARPMPSLGSGEGIAGTIAGSQKPFYIADVQTDLRKEDLYLREHGIRSLLGVPISRNGTLIGVMLVGWRAGREQQKQDVQLMEITAERCGFAILNAQLYQKAERAEARHRKLLETSPDGILVSRDNEIVYANAAALKLFGASHADELVEKSMFNFFHSDLRRCWDERIQKILENEGSILTAEGQIFRLDGSHVDVDLSATQFNDEEGKMMLNIFRDVTVRKQLEAQLRQSQKMEAIGQLSAGIAHDFNNLLSVISGYTDMLLMNSDTLGTNVSNNLRQISGAANRAAALVSQLLAFGRKQVMQAKPLLFNDVITEITKLLKRIIGEDVHLEFHLSENLPFIQADKSMMEQVVMNLAVNARDAMPQGGQLIVSTEKVVLEIPDPESEARAGEFVCLSVADTGTGIAQNALEHIFEPFYTTKEVGKGTGLGLATVYGIVKQHQGWIEVSSKTGKGTTFRIFLPTTRPVPEIPATPKKEPELKGGGETILLAEDDAAVRLVTRKVLEKFGYRVFEADSGPDALNLWKEHMNEIDLLITDLVMPGGLTGRELAEALREERKTLKVMFMSGYSPDLAGKNIDFVTKDHICFVQKPCSPTVLIQAIRACLKSL